MEHILIYMPLTMLYYRQVVYYYTTYHLVYDYQTFNIIECTIDSFYYNVQHLALWQSL